MILRNTWNVFMAKFKYPVHEDEYWGGKKVDNKGRLINVASKFLPNLDIKRYEHWYLSGEKVSATNIRWMFMVNFKNKNVTKVIIRRVKRIKLANNQCTRYNYSAT